MNLDKFVKLSIITGVLTISLSIAYYLVIFIPHKEAVRYENIEKNREKLSECTRAVQENYSQAWNSMCDNNNIPYKNGECILPSSAHVGIDKDRNDQIDYCLKKYPVN